MSWLAVSGLCSAVTWVLLATLPALRWPPARLRLDSRRRHLAGPTSDPPSGAAADRARTRTEIVVAVVPARDEAEMLPATLPALLGQRGLDGVVVVDDGSRDGTGDLARALAAAAPEGAACELVRAEERRPGWSGKVAAQARGLQRAAERFGEIDWLLLVDADILLRHGAVEDLLAVAHDERRDLVSVMARLRARSLWERLLVPPFVYFFQLLYPFRRVRRDDSRVAAAAGGCILVRAAALERAGGFAAIRDRLIDDVALAGAVKRAGGGLWPGLDPGVESLRPYRSLRELWRMVERNAFVQLGFSWPLLGLTLLGLALVFVAPPIGLALAAGELWRGGAIGGDSAGEAGAAAAAFAAAWGLQALALLPSVRHHRAGGLFVWTLPLAAALYGAMTASSAWAHLRGRTSRWRGREYRRGSLGGAGRSDG